MKPSTSVLSHQMLLTQALNLLGSGKAQDALRMFDAVLAEDPCHFDALHYSGVACMSMGRLDLAVARIEKAIALNPGNADAHANLGCALGECGETEAALRRHEQALNLMPGHEGALFNAANLLLKNKKPEAALEKLERLLQTAPQDHEAWNNRGQALLALGQAEAAISSFKQSLVIQPQNLTAWLNLGDVLRAQKRSAEAYSAYSRAQEFCKPSPLLWHQTALALIELQRLPEALVALDQALILAPAMIEALSNRARVLFELQRFGEALVSVNAALTQQPDLLDALLHKGNILRALGRPSEALPSFLKCLQMQPDHVACLAAAIPELSAQERVQEALALCDDAISHNAACVPAWVSRGELLQTLQRHSEAADAFDRAYDLAPDTPLLAGTRWQGRMQRCDWSGYEQNTQAILSGIDRGILVASPMTLCAMPATPAQIHQAALIYIKATYPPVDRKLSSRARPAKQKLKIGYFSSDLRTHPVGAQIVEVLELHDRSEFEVHAFSSGIRAAEGDSIQRRIRTAVDFFYDFPVSSPRGLAEFAFGKGIDIAVDLNGISAGNCLGAFAQRLAAVQVGFLGYPATTGADFIDYYIADNIAAPPTLDKFFSEKIIRLPGSFMPNDRKKPDFSKKASRSGEGLPEDSFVFCCFNNNYKITPDVFVLWMKILRQAPKSVLWLRKYSEETVSNLRSAAKAQGIDPARLFFADKCDYSSHLARHELADVFLDTFYYNAHTTACEALWAGLPVLTLPGLNFASRVGASVVTAAGLDEFVVSSVEEYEALALALYRQPEQLALARQKLVAGKNSCALFDMPIYVKNLEDAYKKIWSDVQVSG